MEDGTRWLVCPPRFYRVDYVINPWMTGNVGRVRGERAAAQWEALVEALARRAAVERIEPDPALPDMVFTANAGLLLDGLFVPARFRFRERRGEEPRFEAWAREAGYRITPLPDGITFEGEGDALLQPGEPLLWGGYGVRTSLAAYREVAPLLDLEVVPLHLIDERFYHLDTCFCPLPGGGALYYPGAFDAASLEEIRRRVPTGRRMEVGRADALGFACNAIVAGDALLTHSASEELGRELRRFGLELVRVRLDEFLMAGGGAKCLALDLSHRRPERTAGGRTAISTQTVELVGHLLDRGLMSRALDAIAAGGGSFEIRALQAGLRRDQDSVARLDVVAPSRERLDGILARLVQMGARVGAVEGDARLERVALDGVAPEDFYSTTIFPTDVRVDGRWRRVAAQRMDAVIAVTRGPGGEPRPECRLIRDLRVGDAVVCGAAGVRTHPSPAAAGRGEGGFGFMTAGVSSERRVELAVERIAWEMRRLRERGGRIVVVGGPVVVHTGGAPHLAALVARGYVQALLGGNGLAVHDAELALFGTSLGVDLRRGQSVEGGHRHHLQAINRIRAAGGLAAAVERGLLRSGIFYECVRRGVPFALAGSIRDDGPLPDTLMDLCEAQRAYAELLRGADMVLMLSSMLHSIGVGNMTPAGVRLICVDIAPAVVTKLADRGSLESIGVVTDVGLFLARLDAALGEPE